MPRASRCQATKAQEREHCSTIRADNGFPGSTGLCAELPKKTEFQACRGEAASRPYLEMPLKTLHEIEHPKPARPRAKPHAPSPLPNFPTQPPLNLPIPIFNSSPIPDLQFPFHDLQLHDFTTSRFHDFTISGFHAPKERRHAHHRSSEQSSIKRMQSQMEFRKVRGHLHEL